MLNVKIVPNGPLVLAGPFTAAGEAKDKGYLCRCGASATKPWCDGTHRTCGFQDAGAPAVDAELGAATDSTTTLTAFPNGPVEAKGSVEVARMDGTVVRRADTVYLCRCGASANKPYCDGSHRTCGFTAP